MKINSVIVQDLFGRFHHHLEFRPDERIMIMIGPNGFGKTTTLRLIDVLFNRHVSRLTRIPFREVTVSFDDGTNLVVMRDSDRVDPSADHLPLTLTYELGNGATRIYRPSRVQIDTKDLRLPLSRIEDVIPVLDQVGPRRWVHSQTGEVLDLDDVIALFPDDLPASVRELYAESTEWLQDIRKSIAVRFIDTERLSGRFAPRRWMPPRSKMRYSRRSRDDYSKRTVRIFSEELANLIDRSIAKYGSLSQSLDRTFPVRLVKDSTDPVPSMEMLLQDLKDIERKRSQLEEAGLWDQKQAGIQIPDLASMDPSRRGVLAVYAQDAKQKLSVFDHLYAKVNTFRKIANSRFLHKQVNVSAEGLSVFTSGGEKLDLELLSSGEQHELVILYELLFRTQDSSLILIDEPELSLHVEWQAQFLNDLGEMAKLSNFQAILATHSPDIIADRWDLTIALRGPNDE